MEIAAAISHGDLAIQLDMASAVFARLQRGDASPYGATKAAMIEIFLPSPPGSATTFRVRPSC